MYVIVSWPEISVRLEKRCSFKSKCYLNVLHSKRSFVIGFPPTISCKRVISVHLKLFFSFYRTNYTPNQPEKKPIFGQNDAVLTQLDRPLFWSPLAISKDTVFTTMNTIISQHRGELQESSRWKSFKVHVKCVLKVRHTWPNIWCFECSTGWLKISQSKEQRFILYHKIQADRWQTYVNSRVSVIAVLKITPASPGEVIPEK